MDGLEVSNSTIQTLDYLCKKFGVAVDWTSTNILPQIQQLCGKFIMWKITMGVFSTLLSILVFAALIIFNKKLGSAMYDFGLDNDFWMPLLIFVSFCCMIGLIIYNGYIIITCITFPEKMIADYLSTLMGN